MSNVVHVIGTKNTLYMVIAIWIIGFVAALNYATATAAELGSAMTHPKPAIEVAKKN